MHPLLKKILDPPLIPVSFSYSFTGCETTSWFKGNGKRSAWEAWKSYREVTDAFLYLADNPYYHLDTEDPNFKLFKRFTLVLYDKTGNGNSVNEARKEMFSNIIRTGP